MDGEMRLIRKIQRTGNKAAADILIRKYYDEIYLYVYRQISDKHTAMDLTQTIFISVLQSISHYNRKQASFRTWLYRIATNKTIDYFRRHSQKRKLDMHADVAEIPDDVEFAREVEMKDLLSRLQDYVNTLEADTQQIFRLKFFGEYTFLQIAALFAIPESTVKSKYYRLIKMLREEFQDEYH